MQVLVLSTSYQPLGRVSWQEAVSDVFVGRVEVVSYYKDKFIRTVSGTELMPAVVRFVKGVVKKFFYREPRFSRKAVWARDAGACAYCSKSVSPYSFTYDHVLPVSRGGKTEWTNIVTACPPCNHRKGNRTPEEAGMRLKVKPSVPRHVPILDDWFGRDVPDEWVDFVGAPE